MTRRGPAPTPTRLKVVRNTRQKSREIQNEPTPAADAIIAPENMSLGARKVWNDNVGHLRQSGLITNLDIDAFRRYCEAVAVYNDAIEAYSNSPALVVTTQSGYPMQNPYLAIINAQGAVADRLAARFGMTPSDRTRTGSSIPIDGPFDPINPWTSLPDGFRGKSK